MKILTRRQKDMLAFIQEFIEEHKYSPSVRDIASHFSLASAGGVHKHLKNLEQKGIITVGKNISRSIRIIDKAVLGMEKARVSEATIDLPLKGKVAAGAPIEYQLEGETIAFPESMVRKPDQTYVLQVRGNSMIEECICDGDYVLIEKRDYADNGEMVIAMLNYQEATLKKIYFEGDKIRLQPANFFMKPILVDAKEVSIQGIVIGVVRRFT